MRVGRKTCESRLTRGNLSTRSACHMRVRPRHAPEVPAESANNRRIGAFSRTRRERLREPGWDGEITALAQRQYGVVSRRQLLGLGIGKDAIQHRIASGRLHPLHAGVYAVGHRVIPREGRWTAAVLASGSEAALSHWSAAALWMIRPSSRERVDVTVPHRSRSSERIRRHLADLPADERTVHEGIQVTTVPRTILDLAAVESADTVASLLREAEFRRLSDRLSLPNLIERYPVSAVSAGSSWRSSA